MFKKALLALTIPAAALAAIIPAASAPASPSGTITLLAKFDKKSAVTVDAAKPKGESAGDGFVFSANLTRDGKAAGREEFAQTIVDNRYQGVVMQAQLLLADGTVMLQGGGTNKRAPGAAAPDTQQDMAIVGGTGAYAGASGTVHMTEVGGTTQRLDLAFAP
jgi:hypothetical protein